MTKKEENKEKITHFETVPLIGTEEKVSVGFDKDNNIVLELIDYAYKRENQYIPSSGRETLTDARGQTLKFWYEKNPTTQELLWSIGIDGLDENKKIKTKTILINRLVFKEIINVGMEYFFPNTSASIAKRQIEDILNEKNGFGLIKFLINNKVITEKEYSKKFKLKEYTTRKQLKKFEELGLIKSYGKTKGRIYKLYITKEELEKAISR